MIRPKADSRTISSSSRSECPVDQNHSYLTITLGALPLLEDTLSGSLPLPVATTYQHLPSGPPQWIGMRIESAYLPTSLPPPLPRQVDQLRFASHYYVWAITYHDGSTHGAHHSRKEGQQSVFVHGVCSVIGTQTPILSPRSRLLCSHRGVDGLLLKLSCHDSWRGGGKRREISMI